jgi:tetratricopeptide (TPR) repeat protein
MIAEALILGATLLTAMPQEEVPAETTAMAAPGDAQSAIDRGLKAYWRLRFSAAEAEFQSAYELDPQSAAAAYYLGYSIYKQFEFRRFHAEKERAKQLFARAFELDPEFRPDFKPSH